MRIFLSYRREDSAAWTGRLHDSLAARFGEPNIFQDVEAVRPGENFTDAIDRALARSDAVLAVIGPHWLTAADADGTPRLQQPQDYVRSELMAALAHEVQVIPVLVGAATMPSAAMLPAELEPLAQRQAVTFDDATWRQDVDGLVRALRGETPKVHRRWWVLAAGLVVVAVTAVGIARLLLDDGGSEDDTSLTGCPAPTTAEWTEVDIAGTPADQAASQDGTWSFEVTAGRQRGDGGAWEVLLAITATNESGLPRENGEYWYQLVMDGVEFDPWCFDLVAGNDELESGSSNDVGVGFEVTRDPRTSSLALDVDMGQQPVRIELSEGAPN